ncbi:MAG: tetratricopeptide repeat protein [Patescibacteria group bacterium]|nr:tetratricopeptide repeat protein [Patescibacteria group bacterium]
MNPNENRGNGFLRKKRYEEALKYYQRAIGQAEKPSPNMFILASYCVEKIYEERSKKAEIAGRHSDVEDDASENEIIKMLKSGVSAYPKNAQLWNHLSLTIARIDDKLSLFESARNFLQYTGEINKNEVEKVLSKLLFFGDIEACQIAIEKSPKDFQMPYRQIDCGDNILAKVLATFGPLICPINVMQCLMLAWSPLTELWNSEEMSSHDTSEQYIHLLRREDIRKQILELPDFSCPHLDGVAVILKIMVYYFDGNYNLVKALIEESVNRQDLNQTIKNWIQDIRNEIANYSQGNEEQESEAIVKKELEEKRERSNQVLKEIIKGNYDNLSLENIFIFPFLPPYSKGNPQKIWNSVLSHLKEKNSDEAIRLLQRFIKKQDKKFEDLLRTEKEVLFALFYSRKRFKEAHFLAKEIVDVDGELSHKKEDHPLQEELVAMLTSESENQEEDSAQRADREEALRGFDGLRVYIDKYPGRTMDIVDEYTRDHRRASDEISNFVEYLFLRGAECLELEDVDEGIEIILGFLDIQRADLRHRIPKNQFDRAWRIITLIKRIGKVVELSHLKELFQKASDSDEYFGVLVADELIKKDWYEDEELRRAHQDFLMWIILEKLGLSYNSYLFSKTTSPSQRAPKKKNRKTKVIVEVVEETVTNTQSPTKGWSFFVLAHPNSNNEAIEPIPTAFNDYFKNSLTVGGEEILDKLIYLLMLEPYQRSLFPRLHVLYEGWRKLKRGPVRIFWRINNDRKELYFFVLNRKEAYKK